MCKPIRLLVGFPMLYVVVGPGMAQDQSSREISISLAETASREDVPVYRAQITFRTADCEDAEQSDGVMIRLNESNGTWLQPGDGDFARGQSRTYDLLQLDESGEPTIRTLRDIQMLEISKTGNDGWCISEMELIINGQTIYKANYPRGKWLDNAGGARLVHTISGAKLRRAAEWNSYATRSSSTMLAQTTSN